MRAGVFDADPILIGGPGRTRTCNQTVMSHGMIAARVDFSRYPYRLSTFNDVYCNRFWSETGAVFTAGPAIMDDTRPLR